MTTYFFTALTIGLAGSIHCVGMCGPLLLALPLDAGGRRQVAGQLAVYHAGRILTYAGLGGLFGLLGQGMALAGLQKGLAITAGIVLLGMALSVGGVHWLRGSLPGLSGFKLWVQARIGKLLRKQEFRGLFALGLLNGLLPCGMVYAALAGAVSTAEGATGGLFMAVFGLGTLPLLFAVNLLSRAFNLSVRRRMRWFQPVFLLIAGALLVYRGLQLDLSFFESAVPPAGFDCH